MKKKLFVAALLLVSVFAIAKPRVIVVKDTKGIIKENTEVVDHGSGGSGSDTLSVLPGAMITYLDFSARNAQGTLLYHQQVPANITWIYTLDLPNLPEGCLFTIRDNNGVVYSDYEIQ